MKAIVAVDENWGIGKNGKLLTYLELDMRRFKKLTEGNIVIMGRKTFESLPRRTLLKNRENIILTRDKDFTVEGAKILHSEEDVIKYLYRKNSPKSVFVIGGEEIYKIFMKYCKELYITHIHRVYKADKFFPKPDYKEWETVQSCPTLYENNKGYTFKVYKRTFNYD